MWPQHATAHEALRFLASVCDGTRSHDGMGFCRDHLVWGNFFAKTPPEHWLPEHHHSALFMVRFYRRQLTNAGFDVNQILGGGGPRRCSRREAKAIAPAWFDDPFGFGSQRYWTGARWAGDVRSAPVPTTVSPVG